MDDMVKVAGYVSRFDVADRGGDVVIVLLEEVEPAGTDFTRAHVSPGSSKWRGWGSESRAQPGGGRSPDPHCQRCGQDGKHWHASRVPPVWVAATLPSSSPDEVNRMIGAVSFQSR